MIVGGRNKYHSQKSISIKAGFCYSDNQLFWEKKERTSSLERKQ